MLVASIIVQLFGKWPGNGPKYESKLWPESVEMGQKVGHNMANIIGQKSGSGILPKVCQVTQKVGQKVYQKVGQ